MLRKTWLFFGLFLIGSSVFSLDFSISGNLSSKYSFSEFEFKDLFSGEITPTIELGFNFNKLNIYSGFGFIVNNYKNNYSLSDPDYDPDSGYKSEYESSGSNISNTSLFNIYFGFSPKTNIFKKFILAYPFMLGFAFGQNRFNLYIDIGLRAYYKLNNNWSIFINPSVEFYSFTRLKYKETIQYKDSYEDEDEDNIILNNTGSHIYNRMFFYGKTSIGIKYTFNKRKIID